jgi:hypothetical protein
MNLFNGDCTFQTSFNKVAFSDDRRVTGTFKPPRGKQFAVLLLGTADKSAQDFDIEAALNALGFYRKAPATLATVKPPRDLRTRLREDV